MNPPDQQKLAAELRLRLGLVATAELSDEEVLRITEGSFLRAAAETCLAGESLKVAFVQALNDTAEFFCRFAQAVKGAQKLLRRSNPR